jgi:hypothetical protein
MRFDSTMLRIDDERQIFVDDLLIESAENICRTWHHPEKADMNPLIKKDKPWEHQLETTCNGFQILRDPKDGLFKCWYMHSRDKDSRPGDARIMDRAQHSVLYAESKDGLEWVKPAVGLELDGMKSNAVITHGFGLALVIDPHEKDESKRYKALYSSHAPGVESDRVVIVTSGDGINWSRCAEKPSFGSRGEQLDDVIILNYDPESRLYFINTRHYDMYAISRNLKNPVLGCFTLPYYPLDWRRMNKRRVWQSESPDMVHWSRPYPVMIPEDGSDGLDETFYGMSQYRVGSVVLGFLTCFNYATNTLGAKLVYSRDGKTWDHLNNRKLFVERGSRGEWDEFITAMPSKPVEVGDELYVFYGGSKNHHDWWITGGVEGLDVPEAKDISRVGYGIGLARMRRDGFVSLDAVARPGLLITRHFISSGTQLEINAKCEKGGWITAEAVDAFDNVIEGFGKDECEPFTGDRIDHIFTWKGKNHLPSVTGARSTYPKPEIERLRKIRFYMNKASLYGFTMK